MNIYSLKSEFNIPVQSLFEWHMREGAFERLNPPWQPFQIISKDGSISNGGVVTVKLPLMNNAGIIWKVKHSDYIKIKSFKDTQIKGLFSFWQHQHNFHYQENKSTLEDIVKYALPLGMEKIFSKVIDSRMDSMFRYRHRITKMDNHTHQTIRNAEIKNILVSGSSGFIGSSLIPFLTTGGYTVTRLLRRKPSIEYDIAKRIYWNYSDSGTTSVLKDNFDAVINLNGENIFGLWTKNKKKRIHDSRVKYTQEFCKRLASLDNPPKVLVSASAIGIYENDHNKTFSDIFDYSKTMTNNSEDSKDKDFLATLCKEWEESADLAKSAGIRVVNLRTGIVIGSSGGILKKLMRISKIKSSITINHNGWLSWISLDDLLRVILFCICNKNISGPVNATSPNPVTYLQFMETLKRISNTKLNFEISPKIIEKMLGEMSRYTILSDIKAVPEKLLSCEFDFIFKNLEAALLHTLGKRVNI